MSRQTQEVLEDIFSEKKKVVRVRSTRELVPLLNLVVLLIQELDVLNHSLAVRESKDLISSVNTVINMVGTVKVTNVYEVWCAHKETLEKIIRAQ